MANGCRTLIFLVSFYALFVTLKCEEQNFYSFTMKDIKGEDVSMAKYKGKVVLVVNVASECGYTNSNYRDMVELQDRLGGTHKFAVIAFPCNQFWSQEPGDNSAIEKFARKNYNINFDMFSKINVVGENAHPLYKFLADNSESDPTWNFCKYLINQRGEVEGFWGQSVLPQSLIPVIHNLLEQEHEEL